MSKKPANFSHCAWSHYVKGAFTTMDVVTLVVDTVHERAARRASLAALARGKAVCSNYEAAAATGLLVSFSLSCSFDLLRDRLNSPIRVYVTVHRPL